jgi:hypothetical protein
MGEEQVVAFRTHQVVREQAVRPVAGIADQPPEDRQRKALADHRGCLQGRLVRDRQVVHARQHQALDRCRQLAGAGLCGIAQKLLQEKRVAAGAFDAFADQQALPLDQGVGQAFGFLRAQGRELDGDQGSRSEALPPGAFYGVALRP